MSSFSIGKTRAQRRLALRGFLGGPCTSAGRLGGPGKEGLIQTSSDLCMNWVLSLAGGWKAGKLGKAVTFHINVDERNIYLVEYFSLSFGVSLTLVPLLDGVHTIES